MSMLKFRRGLYNQINAAPLANGTVYIATDEKAMYVDTATERIRIGDFIRVASVKDITPPYSISSLYYVESDNALLKYVETEVDGVKTGAWKQVNGTDDLVTEIAGVKNRVSALEGTVGSAASGLVKDVADLKTLTGTQGTAIQTNADDITALKAAIGMNEEGDVEGLAGSVAKLRSDLTTAEGEIDALQELTQSHAGKISTLETASAKHAEKTYVDSTFVTKASADPILAKVDTANGVTAAIEAAVAVEAERADEAEKALDNAIKAVKNTADNAVSNTIFNQFKSDNTTAIGTAKTEAISAATTAANGYTDGKIAAEVTRADGAYAAKGLEDIVSGHTNTLATLTGEATVAGSVAEAKKAAEDAMAEAQKKTTMADVIAKNYATKTEAQGYADAKDAAITAAQNAANAAQGAANDAQTDATAALEAIGDSTKGLTKAVADNAAAAAKAQKTADDYATAHAGDYTNTQVDNKIKAVSDVVAGHTSSLATLTSTDPSTAGSVAEAKKAGTDAQAAINEWKTAHASDYTNSKIDELVADAKKAGTDAAATAKANGQAIQTLQGAVNTLNGEGEGSVKKAVADAEGRLNTEIANKINAANAMDYKGGVASEDDLDKKTDVKMGDTYVATTKFSFADKRVAYPGDLLIAQGKEENGVIAVPAWDIVHTGYDASLEQTVTTVDGKIQLTSAVGANNGQVAFVAAKDSAASVSVADNTVTIGMVWEDFPVES